ncbi:MAG: sensor histidine kinase [Clostridium sp.]|nr:sensor histidine kinase [Clostridium sp.]
MNSRLYWKNQIPFFILNLLCMLALSVFLQVSGSNPDTIFFILFIWLTILAAGSTILFYRRKREMDALLHMTEELSKRYLTAELMKLPQRADDRVFYRILKLAEKSMLEEIETFKQERTEYKEYIEQWIHEVKTPITAMRLLCENNSSPFTKELLTQLEKVNSYTEQALYYARSEHAETDYSIREIRLSDVIHLAIADNKYLLRQNNVSVNVEETELTVYSDDKWLRFILNQLIVNAVKYRTANPSLQFHAEQKDCRVLLSVADNGIGIPAEDLPRIFEKGFTGRNGRTVQGSTGLGLYLCKRLCGKLEIGLDVRSSQDGTTVVLSFYLNHFLHFC